MRDHLLLTCVRFAPLPSRFLAAI